MPEPTPPTGSALDWALHYAAEGLRVIPIKPGEKRPAPRAWQDAATDDAEVIRAWWTGLYRDHGVGLVLGPQPSGDNLFAVDIDVHGDDGFATLEAWEAEHGALPETWLSITGSGGAHMIFRAPADASVRNQQGHGRRIGPGVDIRGAGGQIVVAPTVHPTGDPYQWGSAPWDAPIADAPDALLEVVADAPEPPSAPPPPPKPHLTSDGENHRTMSDDESPADWLRRGWDWVERLERADWGCLDVRGDDSYWVRPGKPMREGHSAVLHGTDGPFVVWSDDHSLADLHRAGSPTADGSATALSPLQFYAATYHHGDVAAAARDLRSQMPRSTSSMPIDRVTASTPPPNVDPETGEIIDSFDSDTASDHRNLPEEFWDSREVLDQIRDTAHSRLVSADATLLAVLARVVTLTHPNITLPALIGGSGASLNIFGAVIDPSGGGKSAAVSTARYLVPIVRKDIVDPILPSSGEGLIEAFMGWVEEEGPDGKKTKERRQTKTAGFAWVDEGQGLLAQSDRSGSTIMETIRSGWTGGDLGQHNASEDRKRWLKEHKYRLSLMVGFQLAYAAHLIGDGEGGTPQRFTFALATDPTLDPDRPDHGPLNLVHHPNVGERDIEVEASIIRGVKERRTGRSRGTVVVGPLDTHIDLRKLKLAAALGILDGRLSITTEDWELAGVIDTTSCAVRSLAIEQDRGRLAAERSTALRLAVEREEAVDMAKVRRCTEAGSRSIARRVWREGPQTLSAAWRMVKSGHRKNADPEDALALAVDRGWLTVDGEKMARGAADPR